MCVWKSFSAASGRAVLFSSHPLKATNKNDRRDTTVVLVGGRGWIRTIEAKTQQIYSLPPLATRELSHILFSGGSLKKSA